VGQRLRQQRLDGVKLLVSDTLDFLDDIGPVQVGAVDALAGGRPAQQVRLALAPQQDVGFIQTRPDPLRPGRSLRH